MRNQATCSQIFRYNQLDFPQVEIREETRYKLYTSLYDKLDKEKNYFFDQPTLSEIEASNKSSTASLLKVGQSNVLKDATVRENEKPLLFYFELFILLQHEMKDTDFYFYKYLNVFCTFRIRVVYNCNFNLIDYWQYTIFKSFQSFSSTGNSQIFPIHLFG